MYKCHGGDHSKVIYILSVILPLRKDYVEPKEKEIQFGDGASWKDIEADETTFDKKDVSALVTLDDAAKPIEWEQWLGVVQRWKPETLVLHRLKPPRTVQRAPGPGAVRKVECRPFAQRWLQDRKVILHTTLPRAIVCDFLVSSMISCPLQETRQSPRGMKMVGSPIYQNSDAQSAQQQENLACKIGNANY